MYTPEQRTGLRSQLLDRAASDPRIRAAAITGSGADGAEDRWSDIDLAFGVDDDAPIAQVLSDWTSHLYDHHAAVGHTDVRFGVWTYRVFLLSSTLQVDLAFAPASEFRALAPTFRLVFGPAQPPSHFPSPQPSDLLGMAWLHALHARASIARGQFWQAEHMISGIRDNALAMACLRHNLPAVHGRGLDRLPPDLLSRFEGALVRQLDAVELRRALQAAIEALVAEMEHLNVESASGLSETVRKLADTASA